MKKEVKSIEKKEKNLKKGVDFNFYV